MGFLSRGGRWVWDHLPHRYVGNVLTWMGLLYAPLDDSVPLRESIFKAWRRPLSGRVGWLNVFGAVSMFLVTVLILTGVLLSFHYEPSQETGRSSVLYIMTEVSAGWLVRGVHRWAGELLIALVIIHVVRTFFARTYRPPRQANWVVGLLILPVVLGFQFTGEILPWDQAAYWQSVRANELGSTIPVWGWMMTHVSAGVDLSNVTLVRYFALHVVLLPWILFFLLTFHLRLVRRHGIAPPQYRAGGRDAPKLALTVILRSDLGPDDLERVTRLIADAGARGRTLQGTEKTLIHLEGSSREVVDVLALDPAVEEIVPLSEAARGTAFFPRHFYRIVSAVLIAAGALVLLAAWLPPVVGPEADPFMRPDSLEVKWYFEWFVQLRAVLPAGLGFVAPLLFVLLPLLGLFWPIIDRYGPKGPRRPWLAPAAGLFVLGAFTILTIWGILS
jgi:quinol-cytochrome oxidoreductase complex cytochrome b subunit